MRLACKIAFMLSLYLFFAALAHSQTVVTGTPPFGSFGGGPDIINLANLNVHLTMPIENKTGRGIPFVYNLGYNSSIWVPRNSSGTAIWTPTTNWGFTTGLPAWVGSITYYATSGCAGYPPYVVCWSYESNFNYTDPSGTGHPFTFAYGCSNGQCGGTGSTLATDQSGYVLQGVGSAVADRSGTLIYTTTGGFSGSYASLEDTNGNYLTAPVSGSNYVVTDTLGQTVLTLPTAGGTFAVPSGNVTLIYTHQTVRTNFGCSGISEYGPTTQNLISEIDLPDTSKYIFTYEATPGYSGDVTGRLKSVTLPSGGTINYTYSGGNNGIVCADGSTATLQRQTPDGTWTYAHSESGTAWTTTQTDPQSNVTTMNFQGIYLTQSSNALKTSFTCYNNATVPCNSTSITPPITLVASLLRWPDNLQSQINTYYDSTGYGLVTRTDEYDYGPNATTGPLLRTTLTSYASLGNGIVGAPSQVTVNDGSGNTKAQTAYTYDQGSVTVTSGTPQHVSVSGSHGSPTTVTHLVSGSTTLSTTATYYDTGTVNVATDVNGAQTTYSYGGSSCGNSFPTSITEPMSLSRSTTWNCTGGSPASLTDENNATTYYGSGGAWCPWWCPSSVTDPLGNVTSTYSGATYSYSSLSFNGGGSVVNVWNVLDGLGRAHISQKQNPSGSYDSVETDYDAVGRPNKTTQAYAGGTIGQACSGSCPATSTSYDALARPTSVTDAGGGYVNYSYTGNDAYETAGPAPAGENTKRKQLEYDGLGRLTSVCEITGATGSGSCGQTSVQTGYWTKYTYDADDNLTSVTQNAQSGQPQTRSYSYDDLNRLTSETNPESGTTTYLYDGNYLCSGSNGDLTTRTDNAGNNTCFFYDQLHRLTDFETWYNGVRTCRRFRFDGTSNGVVSPPSGATLVGVKGRMVEAETDICSAWPPTPITDEWFSYTARGETSDLWQSTPHSSGYYHSSASYWANGLINVLTGALGYWTNYTPDGEGRVYSAANGNELASTSYNSAGLPTQVNFGSGDRDSFTYDPNTNRMTQYKFSVNGQSVVGNLTWNAVGALASLSITDPFDSVNNQTCSYSHDDLGRIASANCGSIWSQTFSYDPFGNLAKNGTNSFQPTYSYLTNHMTQIGSSSPSYDGDGNVTNDFLHTYSWDGYGRPITIDGASVTYDALGRIVETTNGGTYTQTQYSPTGFKMYILNNQSQSLVKAFVPMPGGTAEVWTPSAVYYRHTDWLGSSRFASTTSRTMYYDGAYAPFGEPYAQTGTGDLSFTGMNQDTVSALYDFPAREYGIQGRWPSPDPAGIAAADPADPQTWNRYAYVRNSPLLLTDPTGMDDSGRTEDPYCNYVECGGGMPDYSPPPDDGLQFIMAPIRVTTAVCISCLYSDWLDFMYFTSTVGNPPQPSWWGTFARNFFGNFVSSKFYKQELAQGGCLRTFVGASIDAANPAGPTGLAGAAGATTMTASAIMRYNAAQAYAAGRTSVLGGKGLLFPQNSIPYNNVLRGSAVTNLAEGGLGYVDGAMLQGLVAEGAAAFKGTCH